MVSPKKIKVNKAESSLSIEWSDGKKNNYPLKFLRDESPDAGNKGETILWRHYDPTHKSAEEKPGMYEVDKIEIVGSYAINIKWKDGYDYGIYSYELLREMGEELQKN